MARVVRVTKFRHVFGQASKKSDCYDNIRITKNAWDSTFCSVNPKFIAIITESAGGGAFLVLPLEQVGRVDRNAPLVTGHKSTVLDIAWCPHNDNIIASGSDDCTVKVWQIPDGGIKESLTQPVANLVAHQRRVGLVLWHPSALNVLLSAGSDMKIFIWDAARSTVLSKIECHPETILSVSWNYDGSRIVTSCKDKLLRVINPRTSEIISSGVGHQGAKPARAIYLRDGRIFSTGFSKMAERQYAVWDENDLQNSLTMQELDSSNGVIFPFYDEDIGVIYLCGKGDSTIRYFEYTPDAPYIHYLNTYSSSDPQRGMGSMPKRGLNTGACEIARFYKLLNSGLCEVISFTVPRKGDSFQDDLYPDTAAGDYSITADEWISGKDSGPKLMSIRECHGTSKPTTPVTPVSSWSTPPLTGDSSNGTDLKKQHVDVLLEESHALLKLAEVQEKQIRKLEERLSKYSKKSEEPQHKILRDPVPSKPNSLTSTNNPNYEKIVSQLATILSRMDEFDHRLKQLEEKSLIDNSIRKSVIGNEDNDFNDDSKF